MGLPTVFHLSSFLSCFNIYSFHVVITFITKSKYEVQPTKQRGEEQQRAMIGQLLGHQSSHYYHRNFVRQVKFEAEIDT